MKKGAPTGSLKKTTGSLFFLANRWLLLLFFTTTTTTGSDLFFFAKEYSQPLRLLDKQKKESEAYSFVFFLGSEICLGEQVAGL